MDDYSPDLMVARKALREVEEAVNRHDYATAEKLAERASLCAAGIRDWCAEQHKPKAVIQPPAFESPFNSH